MQKIQLSIPEPCHQNWNEMTPTQQGRFCNSCAKAVVDFSTMSDSQMLNYFSHIKNENVCGRAYPDQLERAITMTKEPEKKLFWYWNYITMLFLFFSKTNTAKAQGGIKVVIESQLDRSKKESITKEEIAVNTNRMVTGKIIDERGEPLPGVSIIIKGSKYGTTSDSNGAYKINVNTKEDILQISAVGFEAKEIKLVSLSNFDIILTKMEIQMMGALVITAVKVDEQGYVYTPEPPKHIAIIEVKDYATQRPINKATVVIKRIGANKLITVFTDTKGIYKLRRIQEDDTYTVNITADGYKEEELQIKGYEFEERKILKEIFLIRIIKPENKVSEAVVVTSIGIKREPSELYAEGLASIVNGLQVNLVNRNTDKTSTEPGIRLGMIRRTNDSNKPLLVIDDIIKPIESLGKLNPNDLKKVIVLKNVEAIALYGPAASTSVIVVTTKKKDSLTEYKKLDTVVVKSYMTLRRKELISCTSTIMGSMVSGVTIRRTFTDSIKLITAKITGTLKISPNPVQRGNAFNLSFKLKQTGLYNIQIADAAGRIVLQKQITAAAKDCTHQIQTDNRWSSGVYYIRVLDSNNKMVSTASLILQ